MELLAATASDPGKCMLDMIDHALAEAEKLHPGSVNVIIGCRDSEVRNVADRLIPDARGEDVVMGERLG